MMLDQLRTALKWPEIFDEDRFNNDRKMFEDVVARMRKEDEAGEISPKTLREARAMINDLRAKVTAQPLKDEDDQRQAERFINAYSALIGLLDKPDTRAALAELRKIKGNTTIGNLLGFMHAYNLRFAPATTQKERQIYRQLHETLDQTRDQVLTEAKLDQRPRNQANPQVLTDFYGRIRPRQESQNPPQ